MKTYTRGDNHLVVLPNLPQWAVVDDRGLQLVNLLFERGLSAADIVELYPIEERLDVQDMCEELNEIFSARVEPLEQQNSLTARTTIAMISVTDRCNLKCPHCYVDAQGVAEHELTVAEHREIAKQLRTELATDPAIEYQINLTGGEPFVNKDIIEIVQAYLQSGIGVTMSSNGLLITEEQARFLADNEVTLQVSLDGSTAVTHDMIRGEGNFAKVLSKLRMLGDAGVRVGVNFLVHDKNFDELEQVVTIAHDYGCTGFNPINLVQLGRACESQLVRVPETQIFKRLADHLVANPEQIALFERTSLFSSMGAALLSGVTCASCGVGNRPCVYIDCEGRVYPCSNTQKQEFKLGETRKGHLSEMLRKDHPVLCVLQALEVNTLNPSCAACTVRRFCGGDCRGETFNVTGDIRAPYVACEDRHDSIIELMWIVAEHPELFEKRADEYLSHVSRAV
jgi:radical SAM protein with 4Fe4S-binding SPASM domain